MYPPISNQSGYGKLFKESSMPMYIYETKGLRFLDVNGAAILKYGYSHEQFMALSMLDILSIDDREKFSAAGSNLSHTYSSLGKWLHHRNHGNPFQVEIIAHSSLIENSQVIFAMAINLDERIKIEPCQDSEFSEIEAVLSSITDACYSLNHDWEFTYVNATYEKLMRRKREDMLGKNIWELFPVARQLSYYEQYHRAVNEQVSVHFEEFIPTHQFWISVRAYPSSKGLTVYFMDITEQRKLREEKINDERNLRAIIDNTQDIIWLVDQEFNLIAANEAFRKRISFMMNKPAAEVVKSDYDPQILQIWHAYYQEVLTGSPVNFVWKTEYDGRTTYEEVNFNPVFDEKNSITAISCFSRDITQARYYEEKIKTQNRKLREIALLQSHQVRAPVANIIGLLQLISISDDDPNKEIIEMLQAAANQMDKTIHAITENVGQFECLKYVS